MLRLRSNTGLVDGLEACVLAVLLVDGLGACMLAMLPVGLGACMLAIVPDVCGVGGEGACILA